MLAVAGCTADFAEPSYTVDADGKITFTVGVSIPDAKAMATRGGVLAGTPERERPTGDYLSKLNFYMFVFEDNGSPHANYLRELVYGKDIIPVDDSATAEHPMVGGNDPDHAYKTESGTESEPKSEPKGLVKFKVTLDGTAENAILHLVVTPNEEGEFEAQLRDVPDRSEFGIFAGSSGLFTSAGEAYWKRIELNCPINKDNAGHIQTDLLNHVNLVRNFARVTLKVALDDVSLNEVGGFTPLGFEIVNAVGIGYVAAYNENLGEDGLPGFVEFEKEGKMRLYSDLVKNEQYVPARHPESASGLVNADDDSDNWISGFEDVNPVTTTANNDPKYTFERSVQNEHHTFVIVKGRFGSDPDPVYFKLDIGTKDNTIPEEDRVAEQQIFGVFENYHLIRNMSYDITIKRILNKEVGHKSAEGAIGAPPSNNVSTSIETRPLTSIQDGVDQMRVSKATIVIVDTEVLDENGLPKLDAEGKVMLEPSIKNFDMKWMYTKNYQSKDPSSAPTNIPNEVKWNFPGYEFAFVEGKDPDGIIDSWSGNNGKTGQKETPVWNENAGLSDAKTFADGWMGFTLNFNTPDEIVRQKTIRFYRYDGLTRDVVFISHSRWQFVNDRDTELYPNTVEVFPGAWSYDNNTLNKSWETLNDIRANIPSGNVGSRRGEEFTVMFELPSGLPQAIFPLEFKIGTDRQNNENAYEGNALVVWGTSMFEGDPDEIGVPRMQYIKTVTWDYYNGNGIAGSPNEKGHRVVTVRFLTTTDVKDTDEVQYSSTTRVRVDNEYFVRGESSFDRDANLEDEKNWYWHWVFNYPNWANYFAGLSTIGNADTFDGLSFNNYELSVNKPKQGDVGIVTGSSDVNNPDFSILIDDEIQEFTSNTTLTLTMIASVYDRGHRPGGAGKNWTRYNRYIYVRVITDKSDSRVVTLDCRDDRSDTDALFEHFADIVYNNLTATFNIGADEKVQKVVITSGPGAKQASKDVIIDHGARYHEIRMKVTKN